MLTTELLKTRFTSSVQQAFYHLVYWYSALLLFTFFISDINYFNALGQLTGYTNPFLIMLALAALLAVCFTFFDLFFGDRFMRFFSVRALALIRLIFFVGVVSLILLFLQAIDPEQPLLLYIKSTWKELPSLLVENRRFVVYFLLLAGLNHFIKEMIKRLGSGNYFNWLMGMLKKPREEERVFMFIDMKDSTTLAEKMDHKKFSFLVQDIFNDLSIVNNYHGDIYQYLGDGAIVSWKFTSGTENNNCLKAFFAFQKVVERKSKYYTRRYGFVPKFKAGLHVGKIMVLQVGRIRRDISYNGDTINTTARIESMCNTYKQNLLISGELFSYLKDKEEYQFKSLESIKLKGKRTAVEIVQVKQKQKRTRRATQAKKAAPKKTEVNA